MAEKKKQNPTKYRILRRGGPAALGAPETLTVLSDGTEGHSAAQAMKAAAEESLSQEDLDAGVTLVAVPLSNWTEEPVGTYTPPPRLVVGTPEVPGQITVEEALAEAPDETKDS